VLTIGPGIGQFDDAEAGIEWLKGTTPDHAGRYATDLHAFNHGFLIPKLSTGENLEINATLGCLKNILGKPFSGNIPAMGWCQYVTQLDVLRLCDALRNCGSYGNGGTQQDGSHRNTSWTHYLYGQAPQHAPCS